MKRNLLEELVRWKGEKGRKPLILKGARQVGKTYLLETFGKKHFPRFHRINFERHPEACDLFEKDLDPRRIINDLNVYLKTDIAISEDLVIFDEIQACPKAITSLKYFCEDLPGLALCAAGSLLGLHLTPTSYPVGKVDLLHLYPMNFEEFLTAVGDERYVRWFSEQQTLTSIPLLFHHHLWERFKLYLIVGGLPEAVAVFCELQENPREAFAAVRKKQEDLIKIYQADMAKHAGKVNAMHIERAWSSIPTQLARKVEGSASKFQFKGVVPGVKRYQQLVGVIDWLMAAGLVIKIPIVNKAEIPLMAYTKENQFILMLFDVGILGAMSDLAPETLYSYDFGSYKGYVAENFVAQEFTAAGIERLYNWHEGSAEVEFLRQIEGQIIPIEVKSGWVTKAKSLQSFVKKYAPPYSVILGGKNLTINEKKRTRCYPLYLASQI